MNSIAIAFLSLLAGFVLLIKGADFFVEGSSSTARRLRVPSIIIGLTIVAMGTSLPECAVSITASLNGSNALAVSNVIGSNIFNLMIVCGVCAFLSPMSVDRQLLKREDPLSILCAILLLLTGYVDMLLGHVDGLLFLALFVIYLALMIHSALAARKDHPAGSADTDAEEYPLLPVWQCVLYIIGGAAAIKFGGDFVVDGASAIASAFGMSENLIGLTIVALGTSLPELVTSIVAARKNEVDMALGNAIGSNIFNILLVLGIAATISPIGFIRENVIDIVALIIMSLIVWLLALKKEELSRLDGALMILLYIIYFVYIMIR